MLPKQRSIFHLGEEGEREDAINGVTAIDAGDGLVGLQILIKHHGQGSNILIKSSLRPCKKPVKKVYHHFYAEFLKHCCFCHKELSLQKEVYMYRGDQGFCSMECRHKQIVEDEKAGLDANKRMHFGESSHQQARAEAHGPNGTKISVVA
ncbi:hypothetical protein HPP92_009010 [Vanilla planifolia]|uniref:FLZ-type domain-containing protein n=1 Tax=Vanilla planifolia TaxID=51239 RepID=A0A835R9U0_VANPL|nr:hypothetical protein HPP92_009330 [Vanilla planifolia]KAG0486915.1 hypothetical protein HPP92_009010 [Vanilla planifolia]